ncbi:MAG: hypothetical protein AABM29_02845 [Actinomycetota bacterium]
MPPRPGEKLLGAWSPPDFAEAIRKAARAEGLSLSEYLRRALVREALDPSPVAKARRDAIDRLGESTRRDRADDPIETLRKQRERHAGRRAIEGEFSE